MFLSDLELKYFIKIFEFFLVTQSLLKVLLGNCPESGRESGGDTYKHNTFPFWTRGEINQRLINYIIRKLIYFQFWKGKDSKGLSYLCLMFTVLLYCFFPLSLFAFYLQVMILSIKRGKVKCFLYRFIKLINEHKNCQKVT